MTHIMKAGVGLISAPRVFKGELGVSDIRSENGRTTLVVGTPGTRGGVSNGFTMKLPKGGSNELRTEVGSFLEEVLRR
jgi:hypothetical protein